MPSGGVTADFDSAALSAFRAILFGSSLPRAEAGRSRGLFCIRPSGDAIVFRLRAMQNEQTPPVSGRLSDCQSAKLVDLGDEVIDLALGKSTKGCLAFQHMVESLPL